MRYAAYRSRVSTPRASSADLTRSERQPYTRRVRDSLLSVPAEVAELEDALRSGRSEVPPRVGSSPTFGTIVPACSIPSPLSDTRRGGICYQAGGRRPEQ